MANLESVRSRPTAKPTPVISLDFSPHKEVYTYAVGEATIEWNNTFYGHINEVITFTATIVWPPGMSVAGYHWDFGDGSEAGTNPATHTYLQATVNLNVAFTVTDNHGVEWTARKSMYLK